MKKVLIIAYYWPPAGGPGVQRWLKFVKYLRDFEIEPVVYVPENPHYPIVDASFLDEVPKDIVIYKQPIFEPYRFAGFLSKKKTKQISSGIIRTSDQSITEKLLLWIRGNLFIPDARKYWVRPSVEFLHGILRKEGIDTVITTGPPHSVHLIGHYLKEFNTLQWIADFRDPWTSIGYHKKLRLTKLAENRHKELEQLVLNSADKIVVTSQTTKAEFRQLSRKPIKVITNGYDSNRPTGTVLDERFTIAHIGSMLSGRNPENLWQVLAELVAEHKNFERQLCLRFVGVLSKDVFKTIKKYGLEPFVTVEGYVGHDVAITYQQKSQVLLLAEMDSGETKGIIPGKLFEYMAAGRPILGIGPRDWEVATIVSQTKTGAIFDYTSRSDLKNVLLNWFQQYENQDLNVHSLGVATYSRRELTRQLAAYI